MGKYHDLDISNKPVIKQLFSFSVQLQTEALLYSIHSAMFNHSTIQDFSFSVIKQLLINIKTRENWINQTWIQKQQQISQTQPDCFKRSKNSFCHSPCQSTANKLTDFSCPYKFLNQSIGFHFNFEIRNLDALYVVPLITFLFCEKEKLEIHSSFFLLHKWKSIVSLVEIRRSPSIIEHE